MRAGRARVIREARKRAGARVGRPVRASAGRDIAHAARAEAAERRPLVRVRWLYNPSATPLAGLKRTSTKSVMRCATTLMLTTGEAIYPPQCSHPNYRGSPLKRVPCYAQDSFRVCHPLEVLPSSERCRTAPLAALRRSRAPRTLAASPALRSQLSAVSHGEPPHHPHQA